MLPLPLLLLKSSGATATLVSCQSCLLPMLSLIAIYIHIQIHLYLLLAIGCTINAASVTSRMQFCECCGRVDRTLAVKSAERGHTGLRPRGGGSGVHCVNIDFGFAGPCVCSGDRVYEWCRLSVSPSGRVWQRQGVKT